MLIQVFLQILFVIIFMVLSLVIFTIPGFLLLGQLKVILEEKIEKYLVATVLGLVVFTLAAYLLAALHLRFLMWGFLVIGLWGLFKKRSTLSPVNLKELFVSKWFLIVLILGIIVQVAVNAPSGLEYSQGIYFWSSHGHDGIWHLAVMEEMHKNVFPFLNPELAGQKLQNYHFFVDLLMSEITRLFPFSNLDVYFRFMPVLFSLLLGLSSFILVKKWTSKNIAGIWAMFFTYFVGSFGYFLTIPRSHNLSGESIFWVSQTPSVLGNPPHAAAFIILTTFLFSFFQYLKYRSWGFFLLSVILGGCLIEFKVYAGVLVLGGLLVTTIWEIIRRKSFKTLFLFLATLLLSVAIYLPNSANSQDFIIWEPWWPIRTMVVAPDRLNWVELELRRQTYISEGNLKRVIQVEAMALAIFLIGNLGMRFIGFWTIFRQLKGNMFKDYFTLFFLSITTASFLLPILFVQQGVAWNIIQFNQYFLLLFGFLAAITAENFFAYFRLFFIRLIFILIIVILSIPTQLGLLIQFYSNSPLSQVTHEERDALKYLNSISYEDDIILTGTYNRFANADYVPPLPIYSWYDTGYVSAFSSRRTLLSDNEQIDIMGYDYKDLLNERRRLFIDPDPSIQNNPDPEIFNNFVKKYSVDYVYLVYNQNFVAAINELNLEPVFKSQNVRIYKVINE